MKQLKEKQNLRSVGLATLLLVSTSVWAQQNQEKYEALEEVHVVGTRSKPRSSASTPLPVDNITAEDIKSAGQFTIDKALQYRAPSFNTVNIPVSDATALLDPWEIRNLGPSRTLVLINGKRKNMSSLLYVQYSPGRGETGVDLSAIPTEAIKNIEILRDGASAQYGSDAIAGVINILLNDKVNYTTANANFGITGQGDGFSTNISVNGGVSFKSKGFLNYTAAFQKLTSAVRSGKVSAQGELGALGWKAYDKLEDFQKLTKDDRDYDGNPINPNGENAMQADLDVWNNVRQLDNNSKLLNNDINPYLSKYPDAKNINGSGDVTAAKFLINAGFPIGTTTDLYANVAFVTKKVSNFGNHRTPYGVRRQGKSVNGTYLGNPFGNDPDYAGFTPAFEGDLNDYNGTLGIKSEQNGFVIDGSITFGGNSQIYTLNNTFNTDIGVSSPIRFKPGGYIFNHIIGNLDVSKDILENLSVAFGVEGRSEFFESIAGDTASYYMSGSNSFPGTRPENAQLNSRFNMGAYVDFSWDIIKVRGFNWMLNGAGRFENYSDFGDAFVWKGSTRVGLFEDILSLRSSVSSGFRAPSLHQIHQQNKQASFKGGKMETTGLFNNTSSVARQLGIPNLQAEKSFSVTAGLGLNLKNFSLTIDYYDINIKDRIVYSSTIKKSSTAGSNLNNILSSNGIVGLSLFVNGIETQTSGLDVVAGFRNIRLGKSTWAVNLAGNYLIENKIIGVNEPAPVKAEGASILNPQIRSLLTESRPAYKGVLGINLAIGHFRATLNNTLFGPTKFVDTHNGGKAISEGNTVHLKQVFSPAVVTDLSVHYTVAERFSITVAINNIFNVLPSWSLVAEDKIGEATLADATAKKSVEDKITFSQRYTIIARNGSHFSQLGTQFFLGFSYKF